MVTIKSFSLIFLSFHMPPFLNICYCFFLIYMFYIVTLLLKHLKTKDQPPKSVLGL